MHYLKQSTAITLKIGPFLDETDGKTAETGLTISQADVRLSKNGGNIAQKTEAADCTHDELGIYGCPIDATDTNTLGRLQLWVHESGALPVFVDYMVVTANFYDSLFSTDKLQVDLTQIGGVAQSATDLKDFADTGYDPATSKIEGVKLADTTTTNTDMRGTDSAATATNLATVDTVVDGIQTDLSNATDGLGALKALIDAVDGVVDSILIDTGTTLPARFTGVEGATFDTGTDSLEAIRDRGDAAWSAAAGTPSVLIDTTVNAVTDQTHFTLVAGSSVDDAYKDQAIVMYDVTNSDYPSIRKVSAYAGATKTVTLDSAPDFTIVGSDKVKVFVTAPGTTAPTVGQIRIEMEGAGYKLATIEADTNELQTDWVNGGRLDLIIDAILADVTGIGGAAMRGTDSAALAATALSTATWTAAKAAFLDHSIATVDGIVDIILTDTNELQTDWVNGGRLDLILDIIAADVVNIDGDAMRGTDSAATATNLATVDTVVDGIQTDLSNATDGLSALKALIDTVDTVVDAILIDTSTTLQDDLTFIRDEAGGKWQIINNQMIFYKEDASELMRFNLFDVSGDPAMTDVYKRERV